MADCCQTEGEKPSAQPAAAAGPDPLTVYRPLIIITAVSLAVGFLGVFTGHLPFMVAAMGQFFILVAVLKLFDVDGFAMTFARYDLVARRVPAYARIYPFIELVIGLFLFTGVLPVLTHLVTLAIMLIGVVSVTQVIRSGRIVNCACIGAGFTLPVGLVTLFEYQIMALMAAVGLWGMM